MDTVLIVIENPSVSLDLPWKLDERGRCTYNASRTNDPYFSNFLDSVLVEGDEMTELVLSGSVSDIIQSEWSNYYHLHTWIESMDDTCMTDEMKSNLEEWEVVHTGITRAVRLQWVENIMRILNTPKNWEMCVLSTNDPVHMEVVGRQVMSSGVSYYPSWSDDECDESPPINRVEVGLNIPRALIRRMISHSPPELRENMRIALYGGMRLGMLSRRSSDSLPLWLDWSTILSCMDRLSISHESVAYNSVAMLCGKGNLSLRTIPAGALIGTNAPKAFIRTAVNIWNLIRLYHAILPSYPEDIDLIPFGLGVIVGHKHTSYTDSHISQIVPFLHCYVLNLLPHYAKMVKWPLKLNERQMITANVHLLLSIVGGTGLERILQSLKCNEARGMGTLDSIDYIREITYALDKHSRPISLDELETDIVKYLIKISK